MSHRNLQDLPRFDDRWTHLYVEHGRLDVDDGGLALHDVLGVTAIPIDQIAALFLGPGTRTSHAAIKALADNNCLVCWTGEQGVRLYAHGTGGTHSSARLLRQAALYSDAAERMRVIRRMYERRFREPIPLEATLDQIRGMEGARVRDSYRRIAGEIEVAWVGRSYDQDSWVAADPLNRALSSANACLHGLCHAAILSAGYSPAIGFIHTGKMLSFVYDIADLYKIEVTVPLAFRVVKHGADDVERRTRVGCRDAFHGARLLSRILPDIAEVLDAHDAVGEVPGEFEGRAVSLADGASERRVPGKSDATGSGAPVGEGG